MNIAIELSSSLFIISYHQTNESRIRGKLLTFYCPVLSPDVLNEVYCNKNKLIDT